MTIFLCLDDADGLAFNRRRQSRDRVLCERIAALSKSGVLRMNTRTSSLFEGINAPNICAEDLRRKGREGRFLLCRVRRPRAAP